MEEDRMIRQIAAQCAVTRILAESGDLHEASPRIIREICEALGWQAGAIWSLDRSANVLRCEEFWSASPQRFAEFEEISRKMVMTRGLELPGRVWVGRQAEWIPDVTKDGNFPRAEVAQRNGLRAAFAFPIWFRKEILSVVEFFSQQIQQPDGHLLEMMNAVGSQIGQFIECKRLEGLKDEFISTVSHEMQTPLSIIKEGLCLVLDRIPGEVNEEQEGILSMARGNVDRLARIINELLDISSLEAGRVRLRRERVNLHALIVQVADTFRPRAVGKGLEIQIKVPNTALEIYADAEKVVQVLTNLIDNAMKFTPSGNILVSAWAGEERVECSIEDTGVGIPPEDLPRVFSKFEQFGRLSGAGDRGTGLGLAIAKHLIDLHHGEIQVESELSKGTRFRFHLPAYSTDNLLRESLRDRIREASAGGTKVSALRMVFTLSAALGLKELQELFGKRICRSEDAVMESPDGLTLLLADCDCDAAAKVQARCERLLRAALARKGEAAGAQLRCAVATFPDEAQTAEGLLAKTEERCRQLKGQNGKVIPIRPSSQRMAG